MPSVSKKQHNFMEAIAHSKKFAKKVGVPQSVGKDFAEADKGLKFRKGGSTNPMQQGINKPSTHHGQTQLPNVSLSKYSTNRFGTGGDVNYTYGGKGQINKQRTRGGSTFGYEKNVPNINLNKYVGKKSGGLTTKGDDMKKMCYGGKTMKMATGGMAKETMGPRTMAMDVEKGSNVKRPFGESAVQKRGQTKGRNLGDKQMSTVGPKEFGATKKMAKGGMTGTFKRAADGIASKGKTKAKQIMMRKGGKC